MLPFIRVAALAALIALAGCGTQTVLLEAQGEYLLTVMDQLALPGEPVELSARLQAGDFLSDKPGCIVRFDWEGQPYCTTETNVHGVATATFVPPKTGDYFFDADVMPAGLPADPPHSRTLLVAARPSDVPLAVVDIDKTLVASGFGAVLVGQPEPMPGSVEVMSRLAQTDTIVYLTHRPDYFGPKSKGWLDRQGYPRGPVLLSTVSGFLGGSGQFKSAMLRRLRQHFTNIRIGIGDKYSDAIAYQANGLQAFWITSLPPAGDVVGLQDLDLKLIALDPHVQVVTDWQQIGAVLFNGDDYPPARMREAVARMLREALTQPAPPEIADAR